MNRLSLRSASLIAVFALAGCAQLVWEKQGAGPGATSQALTDCRRTAEINSFRLGTGPVIGAPNVIMTPAGPSATFQPPAAVPYPDPLVVQDFTRECMQQKGFALVERR